MLYDCRTVGERDWGIRAAIEGIARGDLVVLPTDTVYGIAADAFKPWAVSALLNAKGRGRHMPPPVLVGSRQTLDGLVFSLPQEARALTEAFWPGALTIVVEQAPTLQWDLGDTYGTVAVRMPLHPVALEVLQHTGPLAVSSANRTGVAAGGHRGRGPGAARVRRRHLPRGRAVLRPDPVQHRRLHRTGAAGPARRRDPVRAAARGRAEHRAVHGGPAVAARTAGAAREPAGVVPLA